MSNKLINAAAQGLTISCQHPHWNEVNPIKRQGLTKEDHYIRRAKEDANIERQNKRQAFIKQVYPKSRILPALFK